VFGFCSAATSKKWKNNFFSVNFDVRIFRKYFRQKNRQKIGVLDSKQS
jgi:hypothetical protein